VQAQLASPGNNDNTAIFSDLRARLVQQDESAINLSEITNDAGLRLTGDKQYFYNRAGYSWSVSDGDYNTEDGKITRVIDGQQKTIWEHDGDGIKYLGNGEASDALLLQLGGLNADATYQIARYKDRDTGLELSVLNGETVLQPAVGTGWTSTATFTGNTGVLLRIIPTADSAEDRIAAVKLVQKIEGEPDVETPIVKNVEDIVDFRKSGWDVEGIDNVGYGKDDANRAYVYDTADNQTLWKFSGDGLVGYDTDTTVYQTVNLNADRQYVVSYLGGAEMHVSVYDGNGLLAQELKSGDMFNTGSDTNIKIVIGSSKNITNPDTEPEGDWTKDKLVKLSFTEINCPLGSYEASKEKYADNSKGYADIATCMDYAYYMLNQMFASKTDATVKNPYGAYESITLSQVETGEDDYEFRADVSGVPVSDKGTDVSQELTQRYKIIYDKENKNIRNDRTIQEPHTGLFPLDEASTKEDGYDGIAVEEGGEAVPHNFHYALRSESEFHYDESADLYFTFLGDDDVYLFINGKLALDIGGAHLAATKTIHLNDMKEQLGLESGNHYTFDFFYLERHTEFSNFYIETNIQLLGAGILEMNFYQNGELIPDGSVVEQGSEVELEYVLTSRVDDMNHVHFTDEGLGIEVGVNGFSYGDQIKLAPGGILVTIYSSDGTIKDKKTFTTPEEIRNYFKELSLNSGEAVSVRGLIYTVQNKLDAEVTVSMDTPRYAGANSNYVASAVTDTGALKIKPALSPVPEKQPEEEKKDEQQKAEEKPAEPQKKEDGKLTSVVNTKSSAVKSPKTGDDVTSVDLLMNGIGALLGVGLCGCAYNRKKKMNDISSEE
ncbi:MAG: fibro-slime domain-containing protein, partial [Lachnospiraceae bacterium]|nr:fibro-slime domain-containing protein [Lachnospiraceae bacterium]